MSVQAHIIYVAALNMDDAAKKLWSSKHERPTHTVSSTLQHNLISPYVVTYSGLKGVFAEHYVSEVNF